jgi:hypothetical protein
MWARIVSALFVLFAFFAALPFAAAQSSPMPSQLLLQTPPKPSSSVKLLPLPPASQIPPLADQAGASNDHIIAPQEPRGWIGALQIQKDGLAMNVQRFGGGPDAPNCAHIRIFQAPEMDSEMVVQMSPGDGGPIQTFQGLPPCRRDLPAPMTAQRFYSLPPMLPVPPRKPFVRPPASQIPLALPKTVQPKPDAPAPKP